MFWQVYVVPVSQMEEPAAGDNPRKSKRNTTPRESKKYRKTDLGSVDERRNSIGADTFPPYIGRSADV